MKNPSLFLFVCLSIIAGCKDDPAIDPKAGQIGALTLKDLANTGTAEDYVVVFNPVQDESRISEYRVILLKTGASIPSVVQASGLASTNYQSIAKTGLSISTSLQSGLLDFDGDAIAGGSSYKAIVLSVADGTIATENELSNSSADISLEVTDLVTTLVDELPIGSGGMCVDADGNIYTADFGTALGAGGVPGTVIYKITPDGQSSVFARGLTGASGNAFDSEGNLFQSNIAANTISKIDATGQVAMFSNVGLASPVGIAIDADDNLFVANCGNGTIRKITKGGESTQFAASTLLNCANGIAIDTDGNLYVANFQDGNIIKFTPDGQASVFANIPGNGNGHITLVNNELYVVARLGHRIYRLSLQGSLSLIAGSGQRGLDDNSALLATFSLPNDLAASPDGKILYVNDVVNQTGGTIISPVRIRSIHLELED